MTFSETEAKALAPCVIKKARGSESRKAMKAPIAATEIVDSAAVARSDAATALGFCR